MKRPNIYFVYVVPLSFSGQSAASDMLIYGLAGRGWQCVKMPIHPLDRSVRNRLLRFVSFGAKMLKAWLDLLGLLFKSNVLLHLNLGQSLASFLRVILPVFLLKFFRRDSRIVTSLHGSVFMEWKRSALVTKVFFWYLRQSHAVTVLGQRQSDKLIAFGVPAEKIYVVPNTCELDVAQESEVEAKFSDQEEVNLLHLSLLIESKGYPEYLEALEILSRDRELPCDVNAILCGPMSFTAYCSRFLKEVDKEAWIEGKIREINQREASRVRVKWIRGADGEEKAQLFRKAQIFVFPSQFPVEAQPLVLLEAMASGCAVITSDVGEIPSTVDATTAIIEHQACAETLAKHIKQLLSSPKRRLDLGLGGIRVMQKKYTVKSHIDNWERVLRNVI